MDARIGALEVGLQVVPPRPHRGQNRGAVLTNHPDDAIVTGLFGKSPLMFVPFGPFDVRPSFHQTHLKMDCPPSVFRP